MEYDIQKAGILRRISAGLFDAILLMVLICGIAWGVSAIIDMDAKMEAMNAVYDRYEKEYGIDFTITEDALASKPEEEQQKYQEVIDTMNNDEQAIFAYTQVINSFLLIASISVLISHLLLEFLVPLLLKNGQTLGKKVFSVALMRKDGVAVSPFAMFVRSILGKCTIEVMTPVLVLVMLFLGTGGTFGPIVLLGLAVGQIALLIFHPHNAVIHDLLACTIPVDLSSQLIFSSAEAKLEYEKQRAAEKAERAEY